MPQTASIHSYPTKRGRRWYVAWREGPKDARKQRTETQPGYGRQAKEIARERASEIELGRHYVAPPQSLGAFLGEWLERQENQVKPSTLKRKREALRALGVLSEREARAFNTPSAQAQSLSKPGVESSLSENISNKRGGGRERVSASATSPVTQTERSKANVAHAPTDSPQRQLLVGRARPAATDLEPPRRRPASVAHKRSTTTTLASSLLDRLQVADVEDALAVLARRAPRQAQMARAALLMALKDAERRGQRIDKGLLEIKANRYQSREPRFLTWEQVTELQSWMPEYVCRIVPIAALTGAREGELFDLKESDLDLDKAVMRIRSGKTEAATRSVNLPATAVQLFREQLLARTHTEGGYVFPAPRGGRWERHNFLHKVFRPARRRAGLDEGVVFHSLRHTAISLMGAAGIPISVVAQTVGHKDGGALIHKRYRHVFASESVEAASKLDALVRGVETAKVEEAK